MRDHDSNNATPEGLHGQPDGRPYPSWDEMMSRIRRDRPGAEQAAADATPQHEWHDLVADMIVGR